MLSLAKRPNLVGFFSYSRRDDEHSFGEHSLGSLSGLKAKIHSELHIQLGVDLKLWQDKVAIPEGADWESEINKAISESAFFIPIVTPSLVASPHCRKEFKAFLGREEELGRKNLIFPLLYVQVPALEKEERRRQDTLLDIIGRRQYLDWRRFRLRSFEEPEVAEKIAQFCRNIVDSLQQPWESPGERRAAGAAKALRIAEQARLDQEVRERQQAEAEAEAEAQRIAEQERRDQEEKKWIRAEFEIRQKAQLERLAAEQAAAQRIPDQTRGDWEDAKRQQAEAARGDWKRRVAEQAEAQYRADRNRWHAEEERRKAEQSQASRTRRTWLIAMLVSALGVSIALGMLFWFVLSNPR